MRTDHVEQHPRPAQPQDVQLAQTANTEIQTLYRKVLVIWASYAVVSDCGAANCV